MAEPMRMDGGAWRRYKAETQGDFLGSAAVLSVTFIIMLAVVALLERL